MTIERLHPNDPPPDPGWSYDINEQLDRYAKALINDGSELEHFVATQVMSRLGVCPHPETESEMNRRTAGNFFMLCKIIGERDQTRRES